MARHVYHWQWGLAVVEKACEENAVKALLEWRALLYAFSTALGLAGLLFFESTGAKFVVACLTGLPFIAGLIAWRIRRHTFTP